MRFRASGGDAYTRASRSKTHLQINVPRHYIYHGLWDDRRMLGGYARVSTSGQTLALEQVGCDRLFTDAESERDVLRERAAVMPGY
jgi:hypothetical protein